MGWIGVDLDGTLAVYDHWEGADQIGEPIPAMVERVVKWLAAGDDVRIFTARVFALPDDIHRQVEAARATLAITNWSIKHLGHPLPITCTKDFGMIELWDDRCIQLEKNTGRRMDQALE